MKINESINRTVNLLGSSIVALAGFAFMPEIFIEDKIQYKIDDTLLFLLGLFAIFWYKKGRNNVKRSMVPIILVFFALVIKIIGVATEIKEKDDVGDDFGGLILFILSFFLVLSLYRGARKLQEAARGN